MTTTAITPVAGRGPSPFLRRSGDRLLGFFGLLVMLFALAGLAALVFDVARDG